MLVSQKKPSMLDKQYNKRLLSNLQNFNIFYKVLSDINLKTDSVKICRKLSEIYYFEVAHCKFCRPHFGNSDQLAALERSNTLVGSVQVD